MKELAGSIVYTILREEISGFGPMVVFMASEDGLLGGIKSHSLRRS